MYLLPQPKEMKEGQGAYQLTYSGNIRLDEKCPKTAYAYAKLLQKEIRETIACDYSVTTTTGASAKVQNKKCILLKVEEQSSKGNEEYKVSVTKEGIILIGFGEAGLLYAVQTLRQLIRQFGTVIPVVEIEDAPALSNRGFYFDVSRGRIPTMEQLKQLADMCSFYKINQLQLYVETSYLFEEFSETWRDNTPLTAEEIMEFDDYCAALHIELVPSLSSFGHLYGVLRTKKYGHLSEMEDDGKNFYLLDRMAHHTVDVTNDESFEMVKGRILDYMKLFRSNKFNICADETFDLGKGKSKPVADEKGTTELYVEFLNKLCKLVLDAGKIPMFWGDVLINNPEVITRLPEDGICLNWEYNADVTDENIKKFLKAGTKHLYVCPGVQSWHYLINKHHDAYLNISATCANAHKYKVDGVLNTCWGDLGHISHPEFATVGLIYGAAFSWSNEVMPEEEINAQISLLEYGDRSGEVISLISDIAQRENVNWWRVVEYEEAVLKGTNPEEVCENLLKQDVKEISENLKKIEENIEKLYNKLIFIDSRSREKVVANLIMAKGQMLWMVVCAVVTSVVMKTEQPFTKDYWGLAQEVEEWLMDYKKLWRKVSRESELRRLVDVTCWYTDFLREITK